MCNAVPVIYIGKLSVFWHFEKLTNNGFELRLELIHFFQFIVYLHVCYQPTNVLPSFMPKINVLHWKKNWLLVKYCWCAIEILTLTLNFGVVAFKFNHKLVCKSCRLFKICAFNLPKEPHFEETLLLLKSLLARE